MTKNMMIRVGLIAVSAVLSFAAATGCSKKSAAKYPSRPSAKYSMDQLSQLDHNTEEYDRIVENAFREAKQHPLSTFSIDVDTASYSNIRRFVNDSHQLPPADAVRIEEMINYFAYDYPTPQGTAPFSVTTEIAACPWNQKNLLVHIGVQGKRLDDEEIKPCNLVFLLDTSGSMSDSNKLPLLKRSLRLLLQELGPEDRVAVVAYAGSAGLVLPSTPATEMRKILKAIDSLRSGGSTAGGEGIQLAYEVAKKALIKDGNNRVILATDGDFNVGVSSTGELVRLIESKRDEGIFLTICGFGMGNYKDGRMEQISNAGNGNYFYIDSILEARKVFVGELRSNLFVIAKDVKIQVEFNPVKIKSYRLIGYENRVMANEDFNDDRKDAGELGAGHTVTALYELVPVGSQSPVRKHDELKYQETTIKPGATQTDEVMTIKLRYKLPKLDESKLLVYTIEGKHITKTTSDNFRFSAAVAGLGMLLRKSQYASGYAWAEVVELADGSKGSDPHKYRAEFIELAKSCSLLSK